MKKLKFEVMRVEIICNHPDEKVDVKEVREKLWIKLFAYASNTDYKIHRCGDKIILTLQKPLALSTINSILNAVHNETSFTVRRMEYDYCISMVKAFNH